MIWVLLATGLGFLVSPLVPFYWLSTETSEFFTNAFGQVSEFFSNLG